LKFSSENFNGFARGVVVAVSGAAAASAFGSQEWAWLLVEVVGL
jgi:hypothetical protein